MKERVTGMVLSAATIGEYDKRVVLLTKGGASPPSPEGQDAPEVRCLLQRNRLPLGSFLFIEDGILIA